MAYSDSAETFSYLDIIIYFVASTVGLILFSWLYRKFAFRLCANANQSALYSAVDAQHMKSIEVRQAVPKGDYHSVPTTTSSGASGVVYVIPTTNTVIVETTTPLGLSRMTGDSSSFSIFIKPFNKAMDFSRGISQKRQVIICL